MSVMIATQANQKIKGALWGRHLRRFCARPLALRVSSAALPLLFAAPISAQTLPVTDAGKTADGKPKAETVTPLTIVNPQSTTANSSTVPLNVLNVGNAATSAVASPGVGALETLRGNGGRTGYALAHNPIIPASLSVYASGKRLKLNEDFWLDASSGTLYFASPLRASESISVAYRYLEGDAAKALQQSAAGLQLNLGEATHFNVLYGLNSLQENGANLALNGLRMDSLFGSSGKSRYSGLVYLADLHPSKDTSASWRDLLDTAKPKSALAPALTGSGSGHILSQSLAVQTSGLRLSADFQDVSKQFAGFADLKKGAASDKTALAQLAQMEKEKGLQRLGFGVGLGGLQAAKPTDGLTIEWNQIQDKTANDAKKRAPASPFAVKLAGQTDVPGTSKTADKLTPEPVPADTLPASRRESLDCKAAA